MTGVVLPELSRIEGLLARDQAARGNGNPAAKGLALLRFLLGVTPGLAFGFLFRPGPFHTVEIDAGRPHQMSAHDFIEGSATWRDGRLAILHDRFAAGTLCQKERLELRRFAQLPYHVEQGRHRFRQVAQNFIHTAAFTEGFYEVLPPGLFQKLEQRFIAHLGTLA